MTISESIIEWLEGYNLKVLDVETEQLEAVSEAYGFFKQPERNIEYFIDGSQKITEYYTFLTKQDSNLNIQRVSNGEFLESLEEWVEDKNFNEDFPTLTNGIVTDIAIANSFYVQEQNEETAVYQLSLEIIYIKERTK
jgi:hypothetical protein